MPPSLGTVEYWLIVGVCVGVGILLAPYIVHFAWSNKIKLVLALAAGYVGETSQPGLFPTLAISTFVCLWGLGLGMSKSKPMVQQFVERYGTRK
jgi:hypothetical protein